MFTGIARADVAAPASCASPHTQAGAPAYPALLEPLAQQCPDDVPCRVHDGDLWFGDTPSELDRAKTLCLDCPARAACLRGALQRREPWGVWGGEIFERGAIVSHKRPRGRPRKDARRTGAAA